MIGPVPQHLIGVEVIEAIGDAMDLQRLSFDLLRRGFGVEAARVKLSVTNPSPELEQVMREAVDVLSGAMDYWCTVVCNHTLFPDDPPCSKTDWVTQFYYKICTKVLRAIRQKAVSY